MTEWPLTVAALLFLVAYAAPIIDLDLSPHLRLVCRVVTWLTWVLFVVDFAGRLYLAEDRARYALRHWLDILIIGLPLLRPLRLLRLVTLLNVLNRRATNKLRGRIAVYVAGGSALLAFCGALAVLDAERANPGANIANIDDALWWAITTMTTVGYGARYPTTDQGRIVAAGLMIGGIALLGVVTATLASWLIERVDVAETQHAQDLRVEVASLHEKIDRLTRAMESLDRPPAR